MIRLPLRLLTVGAVLIMAAGCAAPGSTPTLGDSAGSAASAGSIAASPPAASISPVAPGGILPIVASPVLAVGPNRFLYSVLDTTDNQPAARPDRTSTVRFQPPDAASTTGVPPAPVSSTFIWAIDDLSGLYVARVDFDLPGRWAAEVTLDTGGAAPATAQVTFDVVADRPGVGVGMPAPRIDNATAADVGGDLDRLTTDVNPWPGLYQHSVGEMLDAGQPFVLVFASPGFCTSGTCGPTLERVKTAARANPDLAFVQVEPYAEAFVEGRLQPILDAQHDLQPSDAFKRYDLPTETSVLLVDGDGIVRDVFDVLVGTGEVEVALPAIR